MNNPWIDTGPTPDLNDAAHQPPSWLTEEISKAMDHYQYPHTLDGLLMLQQKAKSQLDFWKDQEMEWRKLYASLIPNKVEGTNTIPVDSISVPGKVVEAKVVVKYNYKLDDNDKVWDGLDRIKALGNEGSFVADRLISWTPNFLKTEYVKLQEDAEKGSQFAKDCLKVIESFLTITPATPTIEVREAKKKK